MAIQEIMSSSLQLVFNEGVDESTGNPIYRTRTFNNVKTSVDADQLYAVATAMAGLQEFPLYTIHRRDNSDIYAA